MTDAWLAANQFYVKRFAKADTLFSFIVYREKNVLGTTFLNVTQWRLWSTAPYVEATSPPLPRQSNAAKYASLFDVDWLNGNVICVVGQYRSVTSRIQGEAK